jgi:hypothetical protein
MEFDFLYNVVCLFVCLFFSLYNRGSSSVLVIWSSSIAEYCINVKYYVKKPGGKFVSCLGKYEEIKIHGRVQNWFKTF